jgi:hypothetical protein
LIEEERNESCSSHRELDMEMEDLGLEKDLENSNDLEKDNE